MADYIPPALDWVRKQVELYEGSGGKEGYLLEGTDMPCILFTHVGVKTGAIRKTPLMRVEVDGSYVLIGSMGGQPKNPSWVANIRARPDISLRDREEVFDMRVREVDDPEERSRLWAAAVEAYPDYDAYQEKTERIIPVFLAEPRPA
ncbi:nitroreductase family deazaflavin-dependent oxidoreductase [Halioglobus maricola]|uniref:Nitroreductase family deazaflavin-dependent oxidoreductase n=1 Tax=Halioglobus maricola TaxID=2601894 RepID=A0A5P9NGW8_9GAMM|nr:nitroreductase family deazaflavin-dependent oxidoreductase [Halioglobus maricola]QFU75067.1 nitroreductase family deazaflavin-dependent oxidoreductase [Halioglobus maricola]